MWQFEISQNFAHQLLGFAALIATILAMRWRQGQNIRVLEEGHEAELDKLRHLPVLPLKAEGKCETCAHWDLAEGQAQMAEHPAFVAVTQVVSPAKMSQRAEVDGNGNLLMDDAGDVVKSEPGIPHKARWAEFGACSKHLEARWKADSCDAHKPAALAGAIPTTGLGNSNAAGA